MTISVIFLLCCIPCSTFPGKFTRCSCRRLLRNSHSEKDLRKHQQPGSVQQLSGDTCQIAIPSHTTCRKTQCSFDSDSENAAIDSRAQRCATAFESASGLVLFSGFSSTTAGRLAQRDLSRLPQIVLGIPKFFSELRCRRHNRYRWFFQVLINVSFDEQACVVGRFPRTVISGAILQHEGRQALRNPGSLFVAPSACRISSEHVGLAGWVRFPPKR